jgi:hypothetical protein
MNQDSSRSHSIFTITIEATARDTKSDARGDAGGSWHAVTPQAQVSVVGTCCPGRRL